MKNFNLVALIALTVSMLTACSESSYTPGYAANGYGTNYYGQTGMMNPYLNQSMNPMMNPMMNPAANWQAQFYAQNPYINGSYSHYNQSALMLQSQAMFSLNFRLRTPTFYYPQYTNNNCLLRRQVTYSPTQCACVKAPCDCEQVLARLRKTCKVTRIPSPSVNTTHSDTHDTRADSTIDARSDVRTTADTASTHTQPSESPGDDGVTTNTNKLMSLTLVNEDAAELYYRLARTEEHINKKVYVRHGQNYTCVYDRTQKKGSQHVCDLDINLENGSLYAISRPGTSENPAKYAGSIYKGASLEIAGPDRAPEEGVIKISDPLAQRIYERLPGEKNAAVKRGESIECRIIQNTKDNAIECDIHIKSDTGENLPLKAPATV